MIGEAICNEYLTRAERSCDRRLRPDRPKDRDVAFGQ